MPTKCYNQECNSNRDCFCEKMNVYLVKNGCDNPSFWKQKEPSEPQTIELEGCNLIVDPNLVINPGDLYCAKRNTGCKILTCRKIAMGCVFPVEPEYPYNISECQRILDIV